MMRRWVGGMVVRSYPSDIRAARGGEILGTLLDAGDASLSAFVRQLVSPITAVIIVRSRRALTAPWPVIAANTVCWMAIIAMMRVPFGPGLLLLQAPFPVPPLTALDAYLLPLAVLVLFTFGRSRGAGLLGLVWVYVFMREHQHIFAIDVIEFVVFPAAGFCLMVLRPRSAPVAWRYLWVVPAVGWGTLHLAALDSGRDAMMLSDAGLLRALLPVGITVLFLPVVPALVLGTALAWSPSLLDVTLWAQPPADIWLQAWPPVVLILLVMTRRMAKRAYH